MAITKRIESFATRLLLSAKSVVKLAVCSRRCRKFPPADGDTMIVMGNGPSLADTIAAHSDVLRRLPSLAVNFAPLTDEFFLLRPRYCLMADPVFFSTDGNENLQRLRDNMMRVDWPMTLFVPFGPEPSRVPGSGNSSINLVRFNYVGIEGFAWLENAAYDSRRGMPRPRNVLIPSIMAGIGMGYKQIYIVGADHSWTRTLEVDETNTVISVQPHFYADNDAEQRRVREVYRNIRLHEVIHSFYVAFKSYFTVRRYADSRGVGIYNATPGSFIDAFERRPLPEE